MSLGAQIKQAGSTTFVRVLVSIIVVFCFFFLLWTSSAQEGLMQAITTASPTTHLTFNEAVAIYRDVNANAASAKKDAQDRKSLQQSLTEANLEDEAYQKASVSAAQRLFQIASKVPPDLNCPPPNNSSAKSTIDSAHDVLDCLKVAHQPGTADLLARLGAALTAASEASDQVAQTDKRTAEYNGKLQLIDTHALSSDNLSKIDPDQLIYMFSELTTISSILGGAGPFITYASPFAIQFLLSYSAGALGALIITLIVVVYPGNASITAAGMHFYPRVAVGGLVAICIYLVLGAGSSLVNSGLGGVDADKMNVMGLAFISVLAGAFSDQVAAWLANRASIFFAVAPKVMVADDPPASPPSG